MRACASERVRFLSHGLHAHLELLVIVAHSGHQTLKVLLQHGNLLRMLALHVAHPLLQKLDGVVILLELGTVHLLLALEPRALLARLFECLRGLLALGRLTALLPSELLLHGDELLADVLLLQVDLVRLGVALRDLGPRLLDGVLRRLKLAALALGVLEQLLSAYQLLLQLAYKAKRNVQH